MIQNHIYDGAVQAPSPNFTDKVIKPVFIVMHYTAGWEVKSTLQTFANRSSKVSAQFTIDIDGTIYQHVPCNKRAWHAGPSSYNGVKNLNDHSIGIEFVNPGFLRKVGDDMYQDAYGSRVSGKSVGPMVEAAHARVGSGTFYWPAYSKAQIEAGEALTKALIEAYPIRDIVTHEEIDTRGWKTDPGPAFPMNRFKALLSDLGEDVVDFEVTADELNVRTSPSMASPVQSKLLRGTKVRALEKNAPWVRISPNGWVHGDFLRAAA
ncbi:lysin A, N-acetylmuramoyl-L-alanine amidase domain [Rhodobacter phage RcXuper]|nr:lysin A, N-acetylmuramoyl-L-alanine amidase domain [Rhodobacter phage RcXuper]